MAEYESRGRLIMTAEAWAALDKYGKPNEVWCETLQRLLTNEPMVTAGDAKEIKDAPRAKPSRPRKTKKA